MIVRIYNHGESPCCSSRVLIYTRNGKLSKVKCQRCMEKVDPLDVRDPSPYLIRKTCAV